MSPLSYGQERLWFIDRLQGSVGYHLPMVLHVGGEVDGGLLERVLRAIVERHEVLRTVIGEQEGCGATRRFFGHGRNGRWGMREVENETELKDRLGAFVSHPFDLSADYMVRACLFRGEGVEAVIGVVMHHIASDGWSGGILEKEFRQVYGAMGRGEALVLEPLLLQYRDYAVWQRRYLSGEYLERQLSYWEGRLAGVQTLQLPMDGVRPVVQSMAGEMLSFALDREVSVGLEEVCRQEGVTMYMMMLSVFVVLLQRYSGQEDICVGSPVANRTRRELEGMIGFFVNTLVIRSDLGGDPGFGELLGSCEEGDAGGV